MSGGGNTRGAVTEVPQNDHERPWATPDPWRPREGRRKEGDEVNGKEGGNAA